MALGLGGLAALSLAPYYWTALLFVAFAGLFHLVSQARTWSSAAVLGWLFGLGYFVLGLNWITESFQVDAEQFGAFAIPAIVGLSGLLSGFPALGCGFAKAAGGTGWRLLLALAGAWSATEWLRGNLLTGFPWNLVGYAWGVTDETLQAASVIGVYGLGFVTVALAAMPGLTIGHAESRPLTRWLPLAITAGGILALWGFGALRLASSVPEDVPGVRLRLVQASIPQTLKWEAAESERILALHISLSIRPASVRPTHVIWPETAAPYLVADEPEIRNKIAAAVPPAGSVLTGTVRRVRDPVGRPALLNSLVALDPSGTIRSAYDKVRLVPFGEYTPFSSLLPLKKLTEGSVDFVPGAPGQDFKIPNAPIATPLICYEAIFPQATRENEDSRWLLNVTNDAWFGMSSGPYQHFLAARVRAIETGLPLVRVANSGFSAVTDAFGRVRSILPLNAIGTIDAALPGALARETVYVMYGEMPLIAVMTVSFGGIFASRIARRPGRRTLVHR